MTLQKILSWAVLIGVGTLLGPTSAEAKAKPKPKPTESKRFHAFVSARQATGLSPDLGFGSLPLPLPKAEVAFVTGSHAHFGPVPPPIPKSLLGPLTPALEAKIVAREALILEVFREEALRKPSHIAGGIYFSPALGTPYTPVRPINVFTYFPVFRVSGSMVP